MNIIIFSRQKQQQYNGYLLNLKKCYFVDPKLFVFQSILQFFFGKNNKIGTAGVTGYFAEVELRNDSLSAAELFAVSSEISFSSK